MPVLARIALHVMAQLQNRAHLGARKVRDRAQILAGQPRRRGQNVSVLLHGNCWRPAFHRCSASHGCCPPAAWHLPHSQPRLFSVNISSSAAIACVHVLALQNVRRQEPQHRVAGAVDHDVALQHLGHRQLCQVRRIQLSGHHQPLAAHIHDASCFFASPRNCS